MHKAGGTQFDNNTMWWKACRSDRKDSVARDSSESKEALAYLGQCPVCTECFEFVVIAFNSKMAAMLAILPKLLQCIYLEFSPEQTPRLDHLRVPQVICDLWEEDSKKHSDATHIFCQSKALIGNVANPAMSTISVQNITLYLCHWVHRAHRALNC